MARNSSLAKAIKEFEEEIEGHKAEIRTLENMIEKLREIEKKDIKTNNGKD